jgi:hypothetical protein
MRVCATFLFALASNIKSNTDRGREISAAF